MSLDGSTVNVEDYPLLWIEDTYYTTYKGDTFDLVTNAGNEVWSGDAIDYAAVTNIDLNNQSLTTDFTSDLLNKFVNLTDLRLYDNLITVFEKARLKKLDALRLYFNDLETLDVTEYTALRQLLISNNARLATLTGLPFLTNLFNLNVSDCDLDELDVSNLTQLETLVVNRNNISVLDVTNSPLIEQLQLLNCNVSILNLTNCTVLDYLEAPNNALSALDISNCPLITYIRTHNNQLTAATNSQLLIDLDAHGLSNGYFRSSIFGGGSLTGAGTTAKTNLQGKGWTIVGL